ncbi:NAD(P)-dependent oxidoreductase [Nocardioides jiangxiensis]|uniref:NAD(P)-dependent oxidoreductase n=1 Tax=Nocardioides jiangxiensis TaxID=3064524 RepID=A0ABT9B0N0_9ACTN|nr:NAD(P)-dependent oxidoreductase [Nocardioides sp. WY-20]MDO7868223.1 NAD(P)-dependent oxidoreductase [Nocardioides sp. WY-20]
MDQRPVAVYAALDDDLGPGIATLEAAGFRVVVAGSDEPSDLAAAAPEAVALLVGYGRVDDAVLRALPALRVISLMSQGHDNVDLAACTRADVQVAHLPPVATEEVAVHAWALSLALVRQLPFYGRATAATWLDRPRFAPRRLSDLTVGVVGTGRIAERYAALARGHVGSLLSWSRSGRSLPGTASLADLHDLAATSDVVSLHLPLSGETHHLVDDAFLAAMKPGSWLVNVGRGGLVDSAALARALDSGHLAGAALDVLDEEPPSPGHPLAGRDDVLLTPHVGWFSAESERGYAVEQAANVVAWLRTGAVTHPVS